MYMLTGAMLAALRTLFLTYLMLTKANTEGGVIDSIYGHNCRPDYIGDGTNIA